MVSSPTARRPSKSSSKISDRNQNHRESRAQLRNSSTSQRSNSLLGLLTLIDETSTRRRVAKLAEFSLVSSDWVCGRDGQGCLDGFFQFFLFSKSTAVSAASTVSRSSQSEDFAHVLVALPSPAP
uniref:Uncharacterized protein n=1 Tax=Physcomitrium patens TaxID=3218 RepID=A0A2K1K8E4_PHYPA|nr:hypothetical protein PHYPA_011945 [Physcomitrium patens]